MKDVAIAVCTTLAVIAACSAATFACVDSNRAYNARATACINANGSWITQGGTGGSGMCIASGVSYEGKPR